VLLAEAKVVIKHVFVRVLRLETLSHREWQVVESERVDAKPECPHIRFLARVHLRFVALFVALRGQKFKSATMGQDRVHTFLVENR